MIASTTLKTFALAVLVASAEGANTLRGNNQGNGRDLVEVDMAMGLNQMVCKEHSSGDGSVVCSYRTMPPSDGTRGNLLYDCLYSTNANSNFCLSSEVSRVKYNDVPAQSTTVVVQPTTQKPQPQPDLTQDTQPQAPTGLYGSIGTCPPRPQNTGMSCSAYIPNGSTSSTCVYGMRSPATICKCELENGRMDIPVGWDCYFEGNQDPPTPILLPQPPGEPNKVDHTYHGSDNYSQWSCRPFGMGCASPHTIQSTCSGTTACCPGNILMDWRTNQNTCRHGATDGASSSSTATQPPQPVVNIDANINSIPQSSTAAEAAVSSSSGNMLPNDFQRDTRCPKTNPDEGDSCAWQLRCKYYVQENGVNVGVENCDCANGGFICRPAGNPIFSF